MTWYAWLMETFPLARRSINGSAGGNCKELACPLHVASANASYVCMELPEIRGLAG